MATTTVATINYKNFICTQQELHWLKNNYQNKLKRIHATLNNHKGLEKQSSHKKTMGTFLKSEQPITTLI